MKERLEDWSSEIGKDFWQMIEYLREAGAHTPTVCDCNTCKWYARMMEVGLVKREELLDQNKYHYNLIKELEGSSRFTIETWMLLNETKV